MVLRIVDMYNYPRLVIVLIGGNYNDHQEI